MNNQDKKNKNDIIYKNYILNKTGMWVQFILVLLMLVFVIMSLFDSNYTKVLTLIVGADLLIMAYNNHKIYKRKNFTLIYSAIGVIALIMGVINLIK